MKTRDSFNHTITIGDYIIHSNASRDYNIGQILLIDKHQEFSSLDKVEFKVIKTSKIQKIKYKNDIRKTYAAHCVKLTIEQVDKL